MERQLKSLTRRTKRSANAVKRHQSILQHWWQTFGRVAIGFTVAYRAMNAFERGLQELTEMVKEGIEQTGELVSTQARLAMYYKMSAETAESYQSVFERASGNIQALADASVTSISSLSELTTAIDELGQAKFIPKKQLSRSLANLVDFTVAVAKTTGSTMRQVRQEFQALATGQMRPTNLLIRAAKRLDIITDKEIANLKAMKETGPIIEKIIRKIGAAWEDARKKMIKADPATAFKMWHDAYVRLWAKITEMADEGNIIAKVFYKHFKVIKDKLLAKEIDRAMKQKIVLIQQLAGIIDWALGAFKKFVDVLGAMATAYDNLSDKIKFLLKTLVALETLAITKKLFDKITGGFAATAKAIGGATKALVTFYARLLAIPALGMLIVATFRQINEEIEKAFGVDVLEKLEAKLSAWYDKIKGLIGAPRDIWGTVWANIPGGELVERYFSAFRGEAGSTIERVTGGILEKTKEQLRGLGDILNEVVKEITIPDVKPDLKSWFEGLELTGEGADAAAEALKELSEVTTDFADALDEAIEAGKPEKAVSLIPWAREELKIKIEETRDRIKELAKLSAQTTDELAGRKAVLKIEELNRQLQNFKDRLKEVNKTTVRTDALAQQTIDSYEQQIDRLRTLYGEGTKKFREESLALSKTFLQRLKELRKNASNEMKRVIDETTAKIKASIDEMTALPEWKTGFEGFVEGARRAFEDFKNSGLNSFKLTKNAFDSALDSMADALTDWIMTGKMEWKDFARSALRQISRVLTKAAMAKAIEWGGSILGDLFHEGGVVGKNGQPVLAPASLWENAPRLHNGLGPKEYPAILQKGETVLPKDSGFNFEVNVINKTSQDVTAKKSKPTFQGDKWVMNVVLDAANRDRDGFRKSMQGALSK